MKLQRVPILPQAHAWTVYDSLTDSEMDMYAHLKEALLQQLCSDTDEERVANCHRDNSRSREYRRTWLGH